MAVFTVATGASLLECPMNPAYKLVLASGSPRRKELLSQLGYDFDIVVPNVEEAQQANETPTRYVARLSQDKAFAAQQLLSVRDENAIIIGSDTIVVADDHVLEKPVDYNDAKNMLSLLSDRNHQVMTAVTVRKGSQFKTSVIVTDVWFKPLSLDEIECYWESGEPCDKAGSYAIQGIGGRFVTRIEGSYYAVVGLPLFETDQLLHEFL